MQADLNLAIIAASHFQVLNTQNANGNMPERILNAYLNENFTDCKENSGGGGGVKQEPLIHFYTLWYQSRYEKSVKTSFDNHFTK